MNPNKLIVAVTGASGAIYADALLSTLKSLQHPVDQCGVIFSDYARQVWNFEMETQSLPELPWPVYRNDNMFAPMASGSAGYRTMIIIPCTAGTMGRIASGLANDLISRAADVILKERGKLIIVLREMPLNLIHINNMKLLTEAGAIICPASPSFYTKPADIGSLVKTVTNRVLDLAGFHPDTKRWGQP
jgi:4-hydroxy-3-polyprenylbenzoate decarboxylase